MSALGADPEATPDGGADPEAMPEGGAGPEGVPGGETGTEATPVGGAPAGPARDRPVSKLAVATLVTGILALVPVALACGIAALSVIRRTGRRGRGMAVGGLFAAAAWVVAGGTAGIAAVVTHGFKPKVTVQYSQNAIFKLRAGECLNGQPNGQSYTIVPCATAHDAEVFATFAVPGSTWPGTAVLQQEASTGCGSRVSGYMNPQLLGAGLTQVFIYPDLNSWSAGVRTMICEVRSSNGRMTGSVHNLH
ncbi:MAG: septum formation family protein [Streptosporangiaceae bacterium]|nr:septum formation family protein [Streptosporangiaceae bacterium]MBV9855361.1 septum formation family protein [Streptosporangiaceae bacterium]